jgi:chloride channel 7
VRDLLLKHGEPSPAIDLSPKVEIAPLVVPPGMPLQFLYTIMQEQGLNYVPVVREHGPLEGMVTRCGGRAR